MVGEVEAAGAVDGFLRGAGRPAAGQDGFLVVVVAGPVDGKTPGGCGIGVAEPHQGQGRAVAELAADVGVLAVLADSMPASWGQRSRALASSRWPSEVFVDSGGLAITPSCLTAEASS